MNEAQPLALRLDAASFPHPVTHLQRRETAISWLVLTGQYVYKIKKPVHFDFLDASTLQRRRFLCEEELRLNRRFAPDLYEALVPIAERHGHPEVGSSGAPIEYAVRMRQFEASEELAAQLGSGGGGVGANDLAGLGARLADWHAESPVAQDPHCGDVELVRSQVMDNFSALRAHLGDQHAGQLQSLQEWTQAQLQRLTALLEERRRGGRVRECHGDLHAGNVVRWQGRWVPFDCLEFEPRLRWIDVISDVSFLFMDLMSRSRSDLAHAFVSGYCERGGDYEGLRLLRFFAVYRALVRAKVDAMSIAGDAAHPGAAHSARSDDARARLHGRLDAAEQLSRSGAPALLLMHGVTASGKSWLSEQLISAFGAVRVRSDLERRRLLGTGAYSAQATETTYARLLSCARSALMAGMRIIVDATFLERIHRRSYRALARECACPLVLLDCQAPESVLRSRVRERAHSGTDPSEATTEVLETQLAMRQAFDGEERAFLIEIDTTAPGALERTVSALHARLGADKPADARSSLGR